MRERYLGAFDSIRIDCLNGDKYRTGKTTPDGSPDPSIFSTPEDPVGIQVGTAIATLIRKADHTPAETVGFRQLWGQAKREQLVETSEAEPEVLYDTLETVLPLGLPFAQMAVSDRWFDWPALIDLFPASFSVIKTNRDSFLIDIDLDRLKARITEYFDSDLSHEDIRRRYPDSMRTTTKFDARAVRSELLHQGVPNNNGFVRYAYRPFDTRWLYWEAKSGLLDTPCSDYKPHVFKGNCWLVLQKKARPDLSPPLVISEIGDLNQMNSSAYCVPTRLRDDGLELHGGETQPRPNLSPSAQRYLERLGRSVDDLFYRVIAVLHDPAYRQANADALRAEGPRIPLPGWPDGDEAGAAEALAESAARGRKLAQLLDPDTPVPGVTQGQLRPDVVAIAVPVHHRRPQHGRRRLRPHRRLGPLRLRRRSHARPGPRRPARLHAGGTRRPRRRHTDTGRNHLRHLPQRPRLLAQHPRRRLDLQARRLPGPKEVALLPRAHHPPPAPQARRSPALRRNSPPHRRHPPPDPPEIVGLRRVPSRGPAGRRIRHSRPPLRHSRTPLSSFPHSHLVIPALPPRHSRAGGNPSTIAPQRNDIRNTINYIPRQTPKAGNLFTSDAPTPIPASPFVIPALPFVIPAQAGIQAPTPRKGTTFAIRSTTSRGKRRRPATCSPPTPQLQFPHPPSSFPHSLSSFPRRRESKHFRHSAKERHSPFDQLHPRRRTPKAGNLFTIRPPRTLNSPHRDYVIPTQVGHPSTNAPERTRHSHFDQLHRVEANAEGHATCTSSDAPTRIPASPFGIRRTTHFESYTANRIVIQDITNGSFPHCVYILTNKPGSAFPVQAGVQAPTPRERSSNRVWHPPRTTLNRRIHGHHFVIVSHSALVIPRRRKSTHQHPHGRMRPQQAPRRLLKQMEHRKWKVKLIQGMRTPPASDIV